MAVIKPAPKVPHDGTRLFATISGMTSLANGWERVRSNGGAAGGDRVTCDAFGIGSDARLRELNRELLDGSYHPGPLRRVDIPKPSGGVRTLMIPCIRDRVVQSSAALALTPLFEKEFEDVSYGYRPGRSVKQALLQVQHWRDEGFRYTVDADIESYFDNVPHDLMVKRFLRSVSESPLSELVSLWLETGMPNGRGLAQGSPLSPLLANIYLDDLDEALLKTPVRIVRFADDFVVLTREKDDAEKALAQVHDILGRFGLRLHKEKTRIRSYDEGLAYLGAVFVRGFVMREAKEADEGNFERLMADIARVDAEKAKEKQNLQAGEAQESSAGFDRGVRTLYVLEKDRTLGLKNQAFAVRAADGAEDQTLISAIHPSHLDRIEIGPMADVSVPAIRNAVAFGIELAFVNGHGETEGTVTGPLPARARRHLAQARHVLDPVLKLQLARMFVTARLKNQRALLRRLNQRRGLDQIEQICAKFARSIRTAEFARDIEHLMGTEGEATAKYWRGWSALLLHGWSLPARKRKPALDPVNISLNVACSLLERDIRVVLQARGLHPGFGFLHSVDDGRDALVYDFMELFRSSLVESVVLEAFNTKMLRSEHFMDYEGHHRIRNEGYKALVRAYEERAEGLVKSAKTGKRINWRRLVLEQADDFAAYVDSGRPFEPFLLNY